MRARQREINIFNMSLLDILCGALGVFCFMTLVLFPYWKPTGPNAKEAQQDITAMEEELRSLREKLSKSADGQKLMQQMDDLQRRIQKQQGDLNRAKQELEQAQQKARKLEARNPLVVGMTWNSTHDVDLFLEGVNIKTSKGELTPRMDPNKKQDRTFSDEIRTEVRRGPGTELWSARDGSPGGEQKVYYKYFGSNGNNGPVSVSGYYLFDGKLFYMPTASLSQEHAGTWVGTLFTARDYSVKFEPSPEFKDSFAKELAAIQKPAAKKGAGE